MPEASDNRVLKAARFLATQEMCTVILIGKERGLRRHAHQQGIELPSHIQFLKPMREHIPDFLVDRLQETKKERSRQKVQNLLTSPLYFGAGLVASGEADACVAGSVATTGEVIRAAIKLIGLDDAYDIVSSIFLMALNQGTTLTYADCGVVPYPNAAQLADIALASAQTHRILVDEEPRVALLSFSTKGSARHERTELVLDALDIARKKDPDLIIDGELQFDAAYVPEVADRKAPESAVAGRANVFIFPNLDAGNIGYKITERLAGAVATGPILQGLARPMMDLSRGCSWEDIVNAACVAILMD